MNWVVIILLIVILGVQFCFAGKGLREIVTLDLTQNSELNANISVMAGGIKNLMRDGQAGIEKTLRYWFLLKKIIIMK